MSHFVKEHVTRLFADAGYELVDIHGDRGGIVQGDGLHIVVQPDIAAAASRFADDPEIIEAILADAEGGAPLRLSLYGGSSSADLEGVYLKEWFIDFLKDETSALYYRAQREVNAIFDAEDAPDREWNGDAYVGVVDEFAIADSIGRQKFVRVRRVADQSFNAYESGDEEADREDAASIIEGRSSHGTVDIEIHHVDTNSVIGSFEPFRFISPGDVDPREFETADAAGLISGTALIWPRDESGAHTLELAAELAADAEEDIVAAALRVRASERGLTRDAEVSSSPAMGI